MYPHERSLVERLKDQPFVLLGVNSDKRAKLREAIEREEMTWHSWWDGGTTSGPIAKAWNVKAWPTIYVLDDKGIIRHKGVRDKKMDEAVDALLSEMEETSASTDAG